MSKQCPTVASARFLIMCSAVLSLNSLWSADEGGPEVTTREVFEKRLMIVDEHHSRAMRCSGAVSVEDGRAVRVGMWRVFHSEDDGGGVYKVMSYHNGLLNGGYVEFWPNGQLGVAGKYNDGEMVGVWISYYNTGVIKGLSLFSNERDLISTFNENGLLDEHRFAEFKDLVISLMGGPAE